MFAPATALHVDRNQRKPLEFLVRSGKTPQKITIRARIILAAAAGGPNQAIARRLASRN
jgi:hypothetical protein